MVYSAWRLVQLPRYGSRVGVRAEHTVATLAECQAKPDTKAQSPSDSMTPATERMTTHTVATTSRAREMVDVARKALYPLDPSSSILWPEYWLSSDDMELAVSLFRHQWPGVTCQSPLLIQWKEGFTSVMRNSKFAQVWQEGHEIIYSKTLLSCIMK